MTKYDNKTHLHMMVIGQLPVLLCTLFTSSISLSTVVGEDGLSCSGHSVYSGTVSQRNSQSGFGSGSGAEG